MSNNDADSSCCLFLSIHEVDEGIESTTTTGGNSIDSNPLLSSGTIIMNDDDVEVGSDTIPIGNQQDFDFLTLHDDATISPPPATLQQKLLIDGSRPLLDAPVGNSGRPSLTSTQMSAPHVSSVVQKIVFCF